MTTPSETHGWLLSSVEEAPVGPGRTRPRRAWVPWALGGWATAATTAAVLLLVNPPTVPLVARVALTTPRLALDPAPATIMLQGTTLRASAPATTIQIGLRARFARFALPELHLPDTATVYLTIIGPEGLLDVFYCRSRDLHPPHALLLGHPDAVLAPGNYRLDVRAPFAAEPSVGMYAFRLTR
jgi:hypothetical protein